MKKILLYVVVTVFSFLCGSCRIDGTIEEGENATVSFDTKGLARQASSAGLNESDVNSFPFLITDSKGVVYEGPFGDRPDTLIVQAGECVFELKSRVYSGPEFDRPLYGDEKVVEVSAGEEFEVTLSCRQLTSGVQIIFSQEFREEMPDAFVRISCRDTVSGAVEVIDYHPDETGFCHFLPGLVTINLLKDAGSPPELLTGRYCSESDMLSVTVKMASMEASGAVKVEVDTTLVRFGETYSYGRKREGKSVFDAIDVADLPDFAGDTVWVAGYISGYFVNKNWHNAADSSAVATNIALSSSPEAAWACPAGISTGKCKSLNLKEHPELFGQRIAILGISGTLYDLTGIKKSLDFVLL